MDRPRYHVLTSFPALRWGWLTHLFIAVIATTGHAQPPAQEVLNSERIAAKFGSYGIEVLEQDADFRVSNLYSTDAGATTCRTFAIVRYPQRIDPAFRAEHAAILAGGSVGAVFAAQGWQVRKTHLSYGERAASPKLAQLMGIAAGTPLAEHVYVLDVVRDGRTLEYAALAEIHHPAYLTIGALAAIYGPADEGDRHEIVQALLTVAGERAR
jgi:hypothetical protein